MENKENTKKAQLSKDKLSVDYSREEIEKLLPNLAKELSESNQKNIGVSSNNTESQPKLRSEDEIRKATQSQYDSDSELYLPKTRDYLRRCSTLEEAKEIINHQLKLNEISPEEAEELWELCVKHGVRYFGQKKEWGYYEKTYRNKGNSA